MSLHMILYLVLVVILFFVLWALVMAWMEMRSPSLQSRTRVPEVLPRESRRRLAAVSKPERTRCRGGWMAPPRSLEIPPQ